MNLLAILTLSLVCAALSSDPVIEDLKTPMRELGEACGYEVCPTGVRGMLNVHIVPHTHAEYGFRRTFDEYYDGKLSGNRQDTDINMKRILDFAITELWARGDRKFTLSDTPYLFHWWARRDATVRRMVYQLLRTGRLYLVGGGWGMVDEACTSYHGIIDQFTHALRKLNGTFGHCGRPLVAWQADVLGHSREFASLAAQLGFDGLFVNPISYDDEIIRMQKKMLEMVWRGSDDLGAGTNIFTHKLFDGYWTPPGFCFGNDCQDPLLVTSESLFKNIDDRVDLFIHTMKNRQGPSYATTNVMVIMGMRMAYYDASIWFRNIDQLITSVNARSIVKGHQINLMYSTPACYLKAVYESNVSLPTKQDDFMAVAYDQRNHLTGYYTSRPTIKYMAREGHVYLQMAKQMQVLARLRNNNKYFEDINWAMGIIQDHNVITGTMREYVKHYYTHKMYHAVLKSAYILKQAFNKLRNSPHYTIYHKCSFNESSCANLDDVRSFIVIYNPLAWPVSTPIRLPVRRSRSRFFVYDRTLRKIKSVMMKIPDSVLQIPARNTTADHEIVFMAENLPPLGYRSYYIESDAGVMEPKKRRSIIKKLTRSKKKKYFTRQTNQLKIDDKSLLDEYNYDYYPDEDTTTVNEVIDDGFKVANEDPKVTNDENKVTNDKNKVTNDENKVTNDENKVTNDENKVTDDENKVANDESKVTNDEIKATNEEFNEFNKPKETVQEDEDAGNHEGEESVVTSTTATTISSPTMTTTRSSSTTNVPPDHDNEPDSMYYYRKSNDRFIGNKYITVRLDDRHQAVSVNLSNGVQISLDIGLYYYASDDPVKMNRPDELEPSSIIFKPMDITPSLIMHKKYFKSPVIKTYMVEETHNRFSSWASFALRVYQDRPVIEVDWVVGPIPVDDGIGKDVFIRYATDLANDDFFYTDSNGRQTIKRMKNDRPTYQPVFPSAIPGNFYPVTSKIYIQDTKKNIRFSVFNDRAQGGTSLNEGQIDLMLHRRLLTNIPSMHLNETENDSGIIVRGKHYLYISKADFKPNRIFEKKFAKEIELAPQVLAGPHRAYGVHSRAIWSGHKNEYSGIATKVPIGVHVLTLQEWNAGTMLLRLENYLEKSDVQKSGSKTVFIKNMFTNITINRLRETTLGGNVWLEDHRPLRWTTQDKFVKSFNEFYRGDGSVEYSDDEDVKQYEGVDMENGIRLTPQQIRTFVVWYEFHT